MGHSRQRPRLLFVAGPGGPDPGWWLPRLHEDYRLRVLWCSSAERRRSVTAGPDRQAEHVVLSDHAPWRSQVAAQIAEARPDGVLAFSELVADGCHAEASAAGLPATAAGTAEVMRSKVEQRKRLHEAGLPTPRFRRVTSHDDLVDAVAYVGTPAILKPAVGVGSMATYRVDPATRLRSLWESASATLVADRRGVGRPTFILEELLIGGTRPPDSSLGDQVSVESIVQDGQVHHLAVSDKFPLAPDFRETGDLTISTLGDDVLRSLTAMTAAAITALRLDHCAVHTEFMLTPVGPRIIEVNGRLGGGVAQLLHYSCDFDVVGALARVAVGAEIGATPVPRRWAAQYLVQPPRSAVSVVRSPAAVELMALPGVVSAEVFVDVGSPVEPQRGTSARVARVFAVSDDVDELFALDRCLDDKKIFAYDERETS